jgi:hypothetical protein
MIFSLLKLLRANQKGEGERGANEFAQDQITDILLSPFWIALIIFIPLGLLSGALGFFHLWGGPYGFAKFFFWFFAAIIALIALSMRAIISRSKKIIKSGISSARNIINN